MQPSSLRRLAWALIALVLAPVLSAPGAQVTLAGPLLQGCAGARFSDVCPADWFYADVMELVGRGVISGYSDGTFRPGNEITRDQLIKLVVVGLGLGAPLPGTPTYADVTPDQPEYARVEIASAHRVVGGYDCGAPGEPCDERKRPYFRPKARTNRGQIAKVVANAFALPPLKSTRRVFADVPESSAYYAFVSTIFDYEIIGGYICGGAEPCDEANRPYFRPYAGTTRAQAAKLINRATESRKKMATATPTRLAPAATATGTSARPSPSPTLAATEIPAASATASASPTATPPGIASPTATNIATAPPTATSTASPTATSTDTAVPTQTGTASATATRTSTAAPPTATGTASATATHSSVVPTQTGTASATATHTSTAAPPTATGTSSVTATRTSTRTSTAAPPTATGTASATATHSSVVPTQTGTASATATHTSTAAPPTASATATYTRTALPTGTHTPSATATSTAGAAPASSNTPPPATATSTSTATPTAAVSATATSTPVPPTPTSTSTATSTASPPPSPTSTSVPPTATSTSTATATSTSTATATATSSPTSAAGRLYGLVGQGGLGESLDAGLLQRQYDAGGHLRLLELGWDVLQPAGPAGWASGTAAIFQQRIDAFVAEKPGGLVVLDLGMQYTPAWVAQIDPLVDQYGNVWQASFPNGGANVYWSPAVRRHAAEYIRLIFANLNFHGRLWAVRVGPYQGELLYPHVANPGQNLSFWAFDASAQAQSPVPGWLPGQPSPNGEAERFYHWYVDNLAGTFDFFLAEIRRYHQGYVAPVTPGLGVWEGTARQLIARDLYDPSLGYYGTGNYWQRLFAALPGADAGVINWCSSVGDGSGDDSSANWWQWSSAKMMAHLARLAGRDIFGENPGGNAYDTAGGADPRRTARWIFDTIAREGYRGLLWVRQSDMANPGYLSLEQYGSLVAAHP